MKDNIDRCICGDEVYDPRCPYHAPQNQPARPGYSDPWLTGTDTKGNPPSASTAPDPELLDSVVGKSEHMFDQRVDRSPAENPRPMPWLCWVFGHSYRPIINPDRSWGQSLMIYVCGRCGRKPEEGWS